MQNDYITAHFTERSESLWFTLHSFTHEICIFCGIPPKHHVNSFIKISVSLSLTSFCAMESLVLCELDHLLETFQCPTMYCYQCSFYASEIYKFWWCTSQCYWTKHEISDFSCIATRWSLSNIMNIPIFIKLGMHFFKNK